MSLSDSWKFQESTARKTCYSLKLAYMLDSSTGRVLLSGPLLEVGRVGDGCSYQPSSFLCSHHGCRPAGGVTMPCLALGLIISDLILGFIYKS